MRRIPIMTHYKPKTQAEEIVYREGLRAAHQKGDVKCPYTDVGLAKAWESGYVAALTDILDQ